MEEVNQRVCDLGGPSVLDLHVSRELRFSPPRRNGWESSREELCPMEVLRRVERSFGHALAKVAYIGKHVPGKEKGVDQNDSRNLP